MQEQPQDGENTELYDGRSIKANVKAISYVRTIMTISVGFAAGILGLTGLKGFAFFVVCYAATSAAMMVKMGGSVGAYMPKETTLGFLFGGMGNEGLAFVLYWTLMYALVHIY